MNEVRHKDITAHVTSKGQVTIPKAVRDDLGISAGDQVMFRVEADKAVLVRTPNFLELAGSVSVPPDKKGVPWEEIRRQAWVQRGKELG